ncbi:MAG: cation transporter, partial [Shewanella fodinae]|nr:cation transporter [Shewanella fodinae]
YQFHIDNMHCGGCARKIQALFAEEPGVSVTTDVDSKSLTLTLSDEAMLDETQARDRLKQADYPATAASHWHHFKVTDMTCGHCEATIRKALADADDVTVDLSTKQVSVLSQQDDASLLGLITTAGFTPELGSTTAATWHEFKVPDMTCGHCEASIRKALADADEIKVDLPTKKVAVLSPLDDGQLLASIQTAGYSPEMWSATEDNSHPKSEGASVAAAAPQPEDKANTKTETTTSDATVAPDAAMADGVLMFVPDMSCASCVVKIEKAFANAGVEARVNLADKQVSAAHGVSVADAQHILASAGYRGEVVTDAANAMADKADHDAKDTALESSVDADAWCGYSVDALGHGWGRHDSA